MSDLDGEIVQVLERLTSNVRETYEALSLLFAIAEKLNARLNEVVDVLEHHGLCKRN